MYNDSLKHKWDNENVMDYAIKTAKQEAREEERANSEKEKKEMSRNMARVLKKEGVAINIIVKTTKLTIEEIKAL